MKNKYEISASIPEGVSCSYSEKLFKCGKGSVALERKIDIPGTEIKIEDGKVKFVCQKANKKDIAKIKTNLAHVKNLFKGMIEKFTYTLEICHVHFPMTVKVEGKKIMITNFLGEKKSREAPIVEGVNVEVKGNQVIVSSHDLEKAGRTATNIEKATRIARRDRRVFQDGIFVTAKPGGAI
jgi:large subunit ribosomal protein L6